MAKPKKAHQAVKKSTSKKTTAKKPATKKSSVRKVVAKKAPVVQTAMAMEAELNKMTLSIAAQYEKDIKAQSKELVQLKNKLDKATAKKKSSKDRRVALVTKLKAKPTKSLQIQFEKMKSASEEAKAIADGIQGEFFEVKSSLADIKVAYAKFKTIIKMSAKFSKDYELKLKSQAKAKLKASKTTKVGRKKANSKKKVAKLAQGQN